MKEAMVCEISPLEKIWRQEYVDLLALFPSSKDVVKSDKKTDDKDDERKQVAPKAFCIFASVLGEKHPQHCSGLFRHLESIL